MSTEFKFCAKCGSKNLKSSKFCKDCSNKLGTLSQKKFLSEMGISLEDNTDEDEIVDSKESNNEKISQDLLRENLKFTKSIYYILLLWTILAVVGVIIWVAYLSTIPKIVV